MDVFGRVKEWSRRERLMDALRVALWAVLVLLPLVPQVIYAPGWRFGYLVMALLLLTPVLVWWRRPLVAFSAVSLVSFGQWVAGVDVLPSNRLVLVAVWSVAARCAFRWARAELRVDGHGVSLGLGRAEARA